MNTRNFVYALATLVGIIALAVVFAEDFLKFEELRTLHYPAWIALGVCGTIIIGLEWSNDLIQRRAAGNDRTDSV